MSLSQLPNRIRDILHRQQQTNGWLAFSENFLALARDASQRRREDQKQAKEDKRHQQELEDQRVFQQAMAELPYKKEEIFRQDASSKYGDLGKQTTDIVNRAYASPDLTEQLQLFGQANSLLAQIPEEARKYVTSYDIKDLNSEIKSVRERQTDVEKMTLKAENDTLKAGQQKVSDIQKMLQMAHEATAQSVVERIGIDMEKGIEDPGVLLLKAMTQKPEITSTEVFQKYLSSLKDLGVVPKPGGSSESTAGTRLPDVGDRQDAEVILNSLRGTDPKTRDLEFQLSVSTYADMPETVSKELQKTNLLIGRKEVPFVDAGALSMPAGVASNDQVQKVISYRDHLRTALDNWAATGWKSNSIWNILRPSVRTRLMNEVNDARSPLERGRAPRTESTTETPTASQTKEAPKEDRVMKTVDALLSSGITPDDIRANTEWYSARFKTNGLTVEDVLPMLETSLAPAR